MLDICLLLFIAVGRGELQLMPTNFADLLAKADAIELISLDPEKETRRPGAKEFRGVAVLGSTVVKDGPGLEKLRREVSATVTLQASGHIGLCFRPRHGLRLTVQGKTLDVGICFECSRLESYLDGEQVAVLRFVSSAQSYFDGLLSVAKVPLAKGTLKAQNERSRTCWYTGHGPRLALDWLKVTERPVPVTSMFGPGGRWMDAANSSMNRPGQSAPRRRWSWRWFGRVRSRLRRNAGALPRGRHATVGAVCCPGAAPVGVLRRRPAAAVRPVHVGTGEQQLRRTARSGGDALGGVRHGWLRGRRDRVVAPPAGGVVGRCRTCCSANGGSRMASEQVQQIMAALARKREPVAKEQLARHLGLTGLHTRRRTSTGCDQ